MTIPDLSKRLDVEAVSASMGRARRVAGKEAMKTGWFETDEHGDRVYIVPKRGSATHVWRTWIERYRLARTTQGIRSSIFASIGLPILVATVSCRARRWRSVSVKIGAWTCRKGSSE